MAEIKPPKVFISYAWEDDLKTWVLDFATRLRSDGINSILDQWETVPGDQLTQFMEKSVRESDFVVFICTPTYKRKSDRRRGGVGYEGSIITGEVFSKNNHRKFIPVLRKGKWASAAPSWAASKLFIDFRGVPYSEVSYQQLLDTLFGKSPTAPPLRDDTLREKLEREATEKAERERIAKEEREKLAREVDEKIEDFLHRTPFDSPDAFLSSESLEKRKPLTLSGISTPSNSQDFKPININKNSVITTSADFRRDEGISNVPKQKETKSKPKSAPKKSPRKPNTAITVALIGLAGTIIAALLGSPIIEKWLSPALSVIESATTTTSLISPSRTIEPSILPNEGLTPASTPFFVCVYTVAQNQTFKDVASIFNVSRDFIQDINGTVIQNQNQDFTGQSLIIPNVTQQGCESGHGGFVQYPVSVEDIPTPLPTAITDAKGVAMILVPAGDFVMGSDNWADDEKPVHTVFLDAYYIDKFEVTNSSYKLCENAGVCPKNSGSFNSSRGDNYPIVSVRWYEAKTFCEWRGASLPTEAQWEKAARGKDGFTYPWGEEIDCSKANYEDCNSNLMPIGSFPDAITPYGGFDMAGNVSEWVADWYSRSYYQISPTSNPLGPDTGEKRVVRGGAYSYPYFDFDLRSSRRLSFNPDNWSIWVGFRCARDSNR